MPVRRSCQGSNSLAAKLITRANSAKVDHSVTSCNIQSSSPTINGDSGGNFNNTYSNINFGGSTSPTHTNGSLVNNNQRTSSNGTGNVLTAKQHHQLQRNAYLSTLNKDQLKLECRKRGQKTSGTKLDLVYITL